MMDIDQFKRLEKLFNAALDLPPEGRQVFLERACGRDRATLETVARMLRHGGIEATAESGQSSKKSEIS